MAPIFGYANYDFVSTEAYSKENEPDLTQEVSLRHMAFYYTAFLLCLCLVWIIVFFLLRIIGLRQKTRDQQQRRMYVGSMARNPSLGAQTPTIYVSPANLPPPPKYEAMAPPSYEEVVGIHYPNYQPTVQGIAAQPIIQPITTAVAQSANASSTNNVAASSTTANESEPTTVVTVTTDASRTSVTVASA
ncbi:uncharacterized protein LOC105381071 isoform X2 [Plutella xylostella]|uniref:uncharacterized protein LOC105381071 isoform X2 n=1 Tax=Plutella xylostella TaxID=51655 RepID=UPI0005D0A26E|nr:uncharacterized protein LOC105381071 isoform X2 [Plutella xylostella]